MINLGFFLTFFVNRVELDSTLLSYDIWLSFACATTSSLLAASWPIQRIVNKLMGTSCVDGKLSDSDHSGIVSEFSSKATCGFRFTSYEYLYANIGLIQTISGTYNVKL